MHRLLLGLTLVATTASAEHVVSVGGFTNTTLASFFASPGQTGLSANWLWTKGHFGLSAGLRVAPPSRVAPVPLEGYGRAVMTVAIGPWEPLLGPEVGVSGLSGFAPPPSLRPTDLFMAEQQLTGAVYVAFHTEAVRFRFGRFLLGAFGFDVGTSLTAAGATLRLQLDFISVGVRL